MTALLAHPPANAMECVPLGVDGNLGHTQQAKALNHVLVLAALVSRSRLLRLLSPLSTLTQEVL